MREPSFQSDASLRGQRARGSRQYLSDVDQVCDCLVNVSRRRQVKKKYRFIDNLYFERNVLMCFLFAWRELLQRHLSRLCVVLFPGFADVRLMCLCIGVCVPVLIPECVRVWELLAWVPVC